MEQTIARFLTTSAAALALTVPVQAHAGAPRDAAYSPSLAAEPAVLEDPAGLEFARPESGPNAERPAPGGRLAR